MPTLRAFRGWHSYELQVGTLVLQIRRIGYKPTHTTPYRAPLVHGFKDTYGKWR